MSEHNKYPKGSEWRRWDLHVHTPFSVLNNGFGSNWDIYIANLFRMLIKQKIAVVGITDYFTINGYKKVKEEYLTNDKKLETIFSTEEIVQIKKILVIPNIEFRSNIFVGKNSINFHVIFSENTNIKDIEEKFLHEIDFVYEGDPQSEDKKRKLKEVNLIELGDTLKEQHTEFKSDSSLKVGMKNAVVDDKQISKILSDKRNIFGGKYVFIVAADEDLSSIGWNSRDHLTRKVLIQKSDFLFSSNINTRNWGLGKNPYNEGIQKFISEFKTLKPCIHGSDAHDFEYIGYPCEKRGKQSHDCAINKQDCKLRYCWIKADPTFEGLKQVIYEPEDRVAIQENDPMPLKSTQTIVNFKIDGAVLAPELKFKEANIDLNKGIVAITGGKGGGKTALVDLIANLYEDRMLCNDKNSFIKRVTESKRANNLQTKIKLQNDREYGKEIKERIFIDEASIVYVAQGELEKHVEDPAHLESHINKLVFESNQIKDSELLFDYENIKNEILNVNNKLKIINKTIFDLECDTDSQKEENIIKENKKLETDLEDAKNRVSNFTQNLSLEKIREAEIKQEQLTKLRDKKIQLNNLNFSTKAAIEIAENNFQQFNEEISKIIDYTKKLELSYQFKKIEYEDIELLRNLNNEVGKIIKKTITEIEIFQKELEENEKGIKEHTQLLDRVKELEKLIQLGKDKRLLIESKKAKLDIEYTNRQHLFAELFNRIIEQRNKYIEIIKIFSTEKNDILSELEFTAELIFEQDRFIKVIRDLVDLRKIKINDVNDSDNDIQHFIDILLDLAIEPKFEKVTNIVAGMQPLLLRISQNLKKSETINCLTAYDSMFTNYLNIIPSVRYKKVKLPKLSLGQKATVLIKIYLAQGENPILIDSHDDHLDNEFIMDELVKALRQAKEHRQVIIVSNNGNVVVNSDAEQVIIACRNNEGEISYDTGALEDPSIRAKLLCVLEGGKEAFNKRRQKYNVSI